VIVIVGDVDSAAVQRMAERYFGPLADKPISPQYRSDEPPQSGPKTVAVMSNSLPALMVGYKRPNQYHKDDLAFDVLRLILADGTSGLLYKELVESKKIAQSVDVVAALPGSRFDVSVRLHRGPDRQSPACRKRRPHWMKRWRASPPSRWTRSL